MSAADIWFRSKKRSHDDTPITPPIVQPEPAPVPIMGVPEIPIWLAEARGCDPLPDMPWQQDGMQDGSWMASPAGPGPGQVGMGGMGGFDSAYLFDGSWPAAQQHQQQHGYHDVLAGEQQPPVFGQPFEHAGGPPIFYERAKGLPGAAVPPAVHGSGDRRGVPYDREAGAQQLPYPGHMGPF